MSSSPVLDEVASSPVPRAEGIPVDTQVAFSSWKGIHKPSIEKKQRKLLAKVGALLERFLQDQEVVQLVTLGCRPITTMEQITSGAMAFQLKRSALVFTDRRLLVMPVRSNLKPRFTFSQVRYSDCKVLKMRGFTLQVHYKMGGKERFFHLRGAERRKIKKAILPSIRYENGTQDLMLRRHLCPRCTAELPASIDRCEVCELEFKTISEAMRWSVAIPGGGYFYCRQPLLGVLDALVEGILIVGVVSSILDWSHPQARAVFWGVGLALVVEKAASMYHARQFVSEYLPRDSKVQTMDVRKLMSEGAVEPIEQSYNSTAT
jgi:hypothetical protein